MPAYNFLGLVNDVNRRLNEVELTSTTFSGAIGYYAQVKDAVNSAIHDISHTDFEWPFYHVRVEDTLTAGQVRYAFPSDAKTVDMDSFHIKRDNSLNIDTRKLKLISYEEYLNKHLDDEYNTTNTGIRNIPSLVFRTPDLEYGVVDPPDKAYTVVYEYYKLPVELENHDDVPVFPENFRNVIRGGAMYYAYKFRGDAENAELARQKFDRDVKEMRSIYINRYDYVRSTVLVRTPTASRV